jgi:hypothetical protein
MNRGDVGVHAPETYTRLIALQALCYLIQSFPRLAYFTTHHTLSEESKVRIGKFEE